MSLDRLRRIEARPGNQKWFAGRPPRLDLGRLLISTGSLWISSPGIRMANGLGTTTTIGDCFAALLTPANWKSPYGGTSHTSRPPNGNLPKWHFGNASVANLLYYS